jgi:hypothetical protein
VYYRLGFPAIPIKPRSLLKADLFLYRKYYSSYLVLIFRRSASDVADDGNAFDRKYFVQDVKIEAE